MAGNVVLDKFPDAWNTGVLSTAGSSGLSGASSLLGGLAATNPYLAAGTAILSALSGNTTKISGAGAKSNGEAQSGSGVFSGETSLGFGSHAFDLSKPLNIAIACGVVVGVVFLFKKVTR